MLTGPPLFYLSPEWDERGRLTRHSLVWNALDGHHDEITSWRQALAKRRPLAGEWTPPFAMLERGEQDADFIVAAEATFAVKPAAWEVIKDLARDTAEALPVAFQLGKLSLDFGEDGEGTAFLDGCKRKAGFRGAVELLADRMRGLAPPLA